MKFHCRLIKRVWACISLTLCAHSFAFTLHLRPDGDDSHDGISPATAIQTLARAQKILVARAPQLTEPIKILIAAGNYRGQSVVWTYTSPTHSITFCSAEPNGPKPTFLGPGPDFRAFFVLKAAGALPTNLHFSRLIVEGYDSGISLEGDRESDAGFNSRNRISECEFYRIGNLYTGAAKDATAAVRLVHSRENVIENCIFDQIENARGTPIAGRVDARQRLMHSIYLAHMSSGNQISGCIFGVNSGDAIKIRDASNDIVIERNIFLDRAGADAAASDWFADGRSGPSSTKRSGMEYPSWGVIFRENGLGPHTYDGKELQLYVVHTPAVGVAHTGGAEFRFREERTWRLSPRELTRQQKRIRRHVP